MSENSGEGKGQAERQDDARRPFVEPTVSAPQEVLDATTMFLLQVGVSSGGPDTDGLDTP